MISKTSKEKEREVAAKEQPEDREIDLTLRPKNLTDYIGQEKIKEHRGFFWAPPKNAKNL